MVIHANPSPQVYPNTIGMNWAGSWSATGSRGQRFKLPPTVAPSTALMPNSESGGTRAIHRHNQGVRCPARRAEVGWIRTVGLLPLLPARQTEDECREVRLQTGNATSIKRQPCWLTRLRLRPGRVETSGSCVRQDAANPIKAPARELDSQVSDLDFTLCASRSAPAQVSLAGQFPPRQQGRSALAR